MRIDSSELTDTLPNNNVHNSKLLSFLTSDTTSAACLFSGEPAAMRICSTGIRYVSIGHQGDVSQRPLNVVCTRENAERERERK